MSYNTKSNQSEWLKPKLTYVERATHADYKSTKASINHRWHMACLTAVEQSFIKRRDENVAVQ